MNTTEESKVKYLKNEITAFEGRLTSVKAEIDSLRKTKDTLKNDIEAAKSAHLKDVEQRMVSTRQAAASVDELRRKLETDKAEFQGILSQFQKEKNAFEQERQSTADAKKDAHLTMQRVGDFIRLVRDGSAKL